MDPPAGSKERLAHLGGEEGLLLLDAFPSADEILLWAESGIWPWGLGIQHKKGAPFASEISSQAQLPRAQARQLYELRSRIIPA